MNYFAHPNISRSDLTLYAQKGARTYEAFKITATLLNDEDETVPQTVGILTHQQLLEPDIESKVVTIPRNVLNDDGHKKGAKWKAFEADHEGIPMLKEGEYKSAMGAAMSVRKNIWGLLNDPSSEKELELYWTHEATGLKLKAKLDLFLPQFMGTCLIPDIKTCADIERFVAKDVFQRKLWLQHAHYRAGVKAEYGLDALFHFVCVEKDSLYKVAHVELEPDAIAEADSRYEALLVELADRYERNYWVEARELGTLKVSKRACFGWESRA